MPKGGKLSYTSYKSCIADAKDKGESTAPCESYFHNKPGEASAQAAKPQKVKKKKKPIDGSLDPRKPRKKGITY